MLQAACFVCFLAPVHPRMRFVTGHSYEPGAEPPVGTRTRKFAQNDPHDLKRDRKTRLAIPYNLNIDLTRIAVLLFCQYFISTMRLSDLVKY